MVIKVDVKKTLTRSTAPLASTKFLVTRILTRDLFTVANLHVDNDIIVKLPGINAA